MPSISKRWRAKKDCEARQEVGFYQGGSGSTAVCIEKQENEAANSSWLSGEVGLICCVWSSTPGIVSSVFCFPDLSA